MFGKHEEVFIGVGIQPPCLDFEGPTPASRLRRREYPRIRAALIAVFAGCGGGRLPFVCGQKHEEVFIGVGLQPPCLESRLRSLAEVAARRHSRRMIASLDLTRLDALAPRKALLARVSRDQRDAPVHLVVQRRAGALEELPALAR